MRAMSRLRNGVFALALAGAGLQVAAAAGVAADTEVLPVEGVDAARWRRVAVQLQEAGVPAQTVRECLLAVRQAAENGLPAEPVLSRLEEGAAKGADGAALQQALRVRTESLRTASALLKGAGYAQGGAKQDPLVRAVTLALESGISAGTLQEVLKAGSGSDSERMRTAVEAGEAMRLSGMDEGTAGQLMTDFMRRNMRRTEILRASRFAIQQQQSHMSGARIREQLWDGSGQGSRQGSGVGSGAGAAGSGGGTPSQRGTGPASSGALRAAGASAAGASGGDANSRQGAAGTAGAGTPGGVQSRGQ